MKITRVESIHAGQFRTATTDGVVLLTFTPLEGLSEVVIGFLPQELQPGGGFV